MIMHLAVNSNDSKLGYWAMRIAWNYNADSGNYNIQNHNMDLGDYNIHLTNHNVGLSVIHVYVSWDNVFSQQLFMQVLVS